ncbi:hypothetical protein Tsubulata_014208 [Turnera subulata]|uniref:alcohol dehydrogenase n=1 Tax=Turnera subulata TaxID=218843 RepID=A0A9Q0FML4_9ROSI|nr:hypothetical protein Tsubulata_014208 [Turnera subulata]
MDSHKTSTAGKPIRCKAAIVRTPGEPLVMEEIFVAPPNRYEVRIKIICTSLCYSDVTFWRLKEFPGIFPRILGHEAIGVVESVGEGVDKISEGDTVIPAFLADCEECSDCRSKKSNLCSKLPFKVSPGMPRDGTSRFTDLNGEVIHHFLSVSSFSEYTVVDIAHVTKVDPSVPPNRACLLSCGVSTGVGAAWRTAKVEAGSTVAIFGLGSIGLAVAEGARLCGATRIIGVDLNPTKFEIAKKFGVTDFVAAGECGNKSAGQVVMEMTDGGADYCFECIGSSSLVREAYECCRQGWGKTVVLGVDKPNAEITLSSFDVLHHGKILIGSLFGGLKAKSDIPVLLKRYTDKAKLSRRAVQTTKPAIARTLKQSFEKGHINARKDSTKQLQTLQSNSFPSAIVRVPGERLVIEEIMVAPPNRHEVRIRIICTSLCHSDVTFWKMKEFPAVFPTILGHEAIGVVESVGEDVDRVSEGDTVIPVFLADCEECSDCRSNKSNLCSNLPFKVSHGMPRDDTSRFTGLNGEVIHHFLSVSSFCEYTVVDIAHVTKVDPSAPPDVACLLSCGISTGVGAAWRTANVEAGSTVAIFGLGSIGLAVAEGARLCGATRIIGVDLNPEKLEISKKFGVTDFVGVGECGNKSVGQVINEMTDGGADYCFECVGSSSLVHEAYACCRKGWGKTVVLGVDKPEAQITLTHTDVLCNKKTLIGCLFGGLKPKSDIPILLKRYKDKELRLDEFITHEINFEEINKAFELLVEGKSLRCVIWMNR